MTIGLRGHILEPDFTPSLVYKNAGGWQGVTAAGESVPANVPSSFALSSVQEKEALH